MSLQSRIARLEEAVQRRPTRRLEELAQERVYQERIAANPQGAALLAELERFHERLVSQDPAALPDAVAFVRHCLADPGAREICCLLGEIEGGLEPLSNPTRLPPSQV
jgi:hypothetical protein